MRVKFVSDRDRCETTVQNLRLRPLPARIFVMGTFLRRTWVQFRFNFVPYLRVHRFHGEVFETNLGPLSFPFRPYLRVYHLFLGALSRRTWVTFRFDSVSYLRVCLFHGDVFETNLGSISFHLHPLLARIRFSWGHC